MWNDVKERCKPGCTSFIISQFQIDFRNYVLGKWNRRPWTFCTECSTQLKERNTVKYVLIPNRNPPRKWVYLHHINVSKLWGRFLWRILAGVLGVTFIDWTLNSIAMDIGKIRFNNVFFSFLLYPFLMQVKVVCLAQYWCPGTKSFLPCPACHRWVINLKENEFFKTTPDLCPFHGNTRWLTVTV